MSGALLVAGVSSDAGKTALVTGLCRWLADRGVRVAPFKAQNMALNSGVADDGAEIARAQLVQAAAARAPTEAAMNPVLLKPGGESSSQVVVLGRADGEVTAGSYPARKAALAGVVAEALAGLRSRYDVVVCEGAGSPAEINLRAHDLANMGLARAHDLPVLIVGDIDRGGVLAGFYGTLALLEPADQRLVAGYVVNKFRGDPGLLAPGLAELTRRTGRSVLGVLPFVEGLRLDAEDSLALAAEPATPAAPVGRDGLDIAVLRLPRVSNATDVDALACEPGVSVRLTADPGLVRRADLVVVPGTKATVSDLAWLRTRGLDVALADRAAAGDPVLGICGGYQMLGEEIVDDVESRAGTVGGLGLLPVATRFAADKLVRRRHGSAPAFGGVAAGGYELRHGRVRVADAAEQLLHADDGEPDGCRRGAVAGTSWHGALECDALRRAVLAWVAACRGRDFTTATVAFAAVREQRLDALGRLVADHLDTAAVEQLLAGGAPADLPVLDPPVPAGGLPA